MNLTNYSNEKIFDRLLNNKSNDNYWNYISELRKRKSKDIFQKSILLTNSEIPKERIIGIDILAQFGYPRLYKKIILKKFFQLLKNETDKYAISSLFYGIGHNNENLTDKQIQLICSFKKHKSSRIRYSLAFALLTKEEPIAIQTLIELSKDRDYEIRDWATFGLGSQIEIDNDEIRNALWKRINDKYEAPRFEAIFGLAKRKDEKIKEILKTELERIDEFGSLILEAIEELNDKEFILLIEKQIEENRKLKKIEQSWLVDTLENLKKIE
jgi:HEAT repeat protein